MISDLDKYHGAVLRQLLVAEAGSLRIGVVNLAGRIDAFTIERGACYIKYSTKRLSPWTFTFSRENLIEMIQLSSVYEPVWVFFVCGCDGIVGLPADDARAILPAELGEQTWIRIKRSRNGMYRLMGPGGDHGRAMPRGVQGFVAEVLSRQSVEE